ncbi:MAG: flagellar biosynthetic protein FliO [Sideroxydans sp.]|jgi:flagellar protein FliO/FliZ
MHTPVVAALTGMTAITPVEKSTMLVTLSPVLSRLRERKQTIRRASFALTAAFISPLAIAADAVRTPYVPPPAPVSSGNVVQVIVSLLLVLAAVLVVAWLLKRINLPQQGQGNLLKVISGVAVGQRERVVLVEVNDTWLVVGVAPGQVRALHTLPKGVLPADSTPAGEGKSFRSFLQQMREKRNA